MESVTLSTSSFLAWNFPLPWVSFKAFRVRCSLRVQYCLEDSFVNESSVNVGKQPLATVIRQVPVALEVAVSKAVLSLSLPDGLEDI